MVSRYSRLSKAKDKLSEVSKKLWNSTTFTTWLSYSTKSATLLLVLPLILKRFSAPEIAIWYLFSSILALSGVADLGFRNTFIRAFALGNGGATDIVIIRHNTKSNKEANWELIENLYSITRRIYVYLSVALMVLLLVFGSMSMIKPINDAKDHHTELWISWIVTVIGIVMDFYGKSYANYLEGMNQIATVKKVETLTRLGAILTSFIVLLVAPTILNMSIASTFWMAINTVRDRTLARTVLEGRLARFVKKPFDKVLFHKIWQPAWRTGLSGLMSNGLTNLTSIVYAQLGKAPQVAAYMIALRVITEIRNVSNAPFYSKIPFLVKLRAEGNTQKFVEVAQRSMRFAHFVFIGAAIAAGLFFNVFIHLLGSKVQFVEPQLWLLMTFAFYVHRYGAMHMQLYLTTNHVISHIADGISGIIFILVSVLLLKTVGIYAVPLGMLAGYLGFYAWYSAVYSLKSMSISLFNYERKASLAPFLLFVLFIIFFKFIYV